MSKLEAAKSAESAGRAAALKPAAGAKKGTKKGHKNVQVKVSPKGDVVIRISTSHAHDGE